MERLFLQHTTLYIQLNCELSMTVRTLSPAHTDSDVQPVVVDESSTSEQMTPTNDSDEYNITPLIKTQIVSEDEMSV